MSEYHNYVGRRAELKQAKLKLEIEAASHLDSLRQALDPLVTASALEAETILSLAAALAEIITEVKAAEAGILAINKIIGE